MSESSRPLAWISKSKKTFDRFPDELRAVLFERLEMARDGEQVIPGAKPLTNGILKGMGVVELIENFGGDTYRVVYTVKIATVLAVLHAFKKKSNTGIATPLQEIRLIRTRYMTASRLYGKRERRHGR